MRIILILISLALQGCFLADTALQSGVATTRAVAFTGSIVSSNYIKVLDSRGAPIINATVILFFIELSTGNTTEGYKQMRTNRWGITYLSSPGIEPLQYYTISKFGYNKVTLTGEARLPATVTLKSTKESSANAR